jgi:hypothetical protein
MMGSDSGNGWWKSAIAPSGKDGRFSTREPKEKEGLQTS